MRQTSSAIFAVTLVITVIIGVMYLSVDAFSNGKGLLSLLSPDMPHIGIVHNTLSVSPRQSASPRPLTVHLAVPIWHENYSWVQSIADAHPGWSLIPLTRDEPNNPHNVEPNMGYEAGAWVRYIVRNWDNLPDRVMFVHAHPTSWHTIGQDTAAVVHAVDTSLHWANLNLFYYYKIECCGKEDEWYGNIKRLYDGARLQEFLGPVQPFYASFCCAQFMVSRALIHSRPKALWERLNTFIFSGDYNGMSDKITAVAMEHIWAYLFLNTTVEPRVRDVCTVLDCTIYNGTRQPPLHGTEFGLSANEAAQCKTCAG